MDSVEMLSWIMLIGFYKLCIICIYSLLFLWRIDSGAFSQSSHSFTNTFPTSKPHSVDGSGITPAAPLQCHALLSLDSVDGSFTRVASLVQHWRWMSCILEETCTTSHHSYQLSFIPYLFYFFQIYILETYRQKAEAEGDIRWKLMSKKLKILC